jgi:hypothetical protein
MSESTPPQITPAVFEYYLQRWTQLNGLIISHSEGAINYLLTVNGGALAGMLAFVGSVSQVRNSKCTLWALGLFALGLVLSGVVRAHALETMKIFQAGWSTDFGEYRRGSITWEEWNRRDQARVNRWRYKYVGPLIGYASFVCFLIGLAIAAYLLLHLT